MSFLTTLAPALNRSSTQLAVKDLSLSRNPSYVSQSPDRGQTEDVYKMGVYADPKPVKQWGLGQALFTPEHKKLLTRFREECARLTGHNKELRDRITGLDRKLRRQDVAIERLEAQVAEARHRITDKNEQIESMADELKEAQASLAEMDAIFAGSRHKRLSRLQAKTLEISDEARAELARIP